MVEGKVEIGWWGILEDFERARWVMIKEVRKIDVFLKLLKCYLEWFTWMQVR